MENELLQYILGHGQRFMLRAESQALRQLRISTEGREAYLRSALAEPALENIYGFQNPEALELVALGLPEAEKKIARRIYNEHHQQLLNLCPKCQRLARTPQAKQCRHCGHDWH